MPAGCNGQYSRPIDTPTVLSSADQRDNGAGTPPWDATDATTGVPRRLTPKSGPALIILGIVGFITIGGALLATLGAGPKVTAGEIASPPGLGVPADHAATALRPITVGLEPPSDIVAALVVPTGSRVVGHSDPSASLSLYDGSITFDAPISPKTTIAFYTYELKHDGWHISAIAAGTSGDTNLYALHNSADGYVWEVGVSISDQTGAITPALGGASEPSRTSAVELRLIERDDEE